MAPALLEPAAVSVTEAARLLGLSRRSAYRAAAAGELPTVRIGGRILVPVHRLLELLDQEQRGTTEGSGMR